MANAYLLTLDTRPIGVYATLADARKVKATISTTLLQTIDILELTIGYATTELAAGKMLFVVHWSNILNTNTKTVRQPPLTSRLLDGEVRWDSHHKRFEVASWATTQAAAESAADAIRTAFISNNGIS